jgi:hypothetical protein
LFNNLLLAFLLCTYFNGLLTSLGGEEIQYLYEYLWRLLSNIAVKLSLVVSAPACQNVLHVIKY